MSTIALTEVTRSFGERVALGPIDLEIEPGSKVALIGPSGSGKSTLLKLIAASLEPSSGTMRVNGSALSDVKAHRRSLGIVPQGNMLTPQLSVHRNVLAGMLPHFSWLKVLLSVVWPLEMDSVRKALERVGLGDRQWDRASVLSGGEAQRVAVVRALFNTPSLIIADEPTASLDPTNATAVTNMLLDDAEARGATLLMSTHWVSLVRQRFDRVIGLREGRIVIDGDLDDEDIDALYAGSDERR